VRLSVLATAGMTTLMSLLISANSSTLTSQSPVERTLNLIAALVASEQYQAQPSKTLFQGSRQIK